MLDQESLVKRTKDQIVILFVIETQSKVTVFSDNDQYIIKKMLWTWVP